MWFRRSKTWAVCPPQPPRSPQHTHTNHVVSFQRLCSTKCSEFDISNLEIFIRALFQVSDLEMTQTPPHEKKSLPQSPSSVGQKSPRKSLQRRNNNRNFHIKWGMKVGSKTYLWIENNPVNLYKGTLKINISVNSVWVVKSLTAHILFFFSIFLWAYISFMIRKLNPRLSDRGGLFVFTYRILLVHIMWTFSPNACYHGGHIFQHQTMLNVSIHFLNVSDVVCKTLSAFENFENLLPLTFLDT